MNKIGCTTKSVTEVTKTKSRKEKGDEGEKFVLFALKEMGYVTELHPRTYRPIYLPSKKVIMVSKDNDYHNAFDVKGERSDGMIYVQVKWVNSSAINGGNVSDARKTIDKMYPFYFPYQKIQVWMVWREWTQRQGERRHKEWFFRVWQRDGIAERKERSIHVFVWQWRGVTDIMRNEFESYRERNNFEMSSECNPLEVEDAGN